MRPLARLEYESLSCAQWYFNIFLVPKYFAPRIRAIHFSIVFSLSRLDSFCSPERHKPELSSFFDALVHRKREIALTKDAGIFRSGLHGYRHWRSANQYPRIKHQGNRCLYTLSLLFIKVIAVDKILTCRCQSSDLHQSSFLMFCLVNHSRIKW